MRPDACSDLLALLATARRHAITLIAASIVHDELALAIAAARLRVSLARLDAMQEAVGLDAEMQARVEEVTPLRQLLTIEPDRNQRPDWARFDRWARVRSAGDSGLADPDLFETDASGMHLGLMSFASLYLLKCRLVGSSMPGTVLDNALLDRCDFTRANMERTSLRRSRVIRSTFAGCQLVDAVLDDAIFIECDLRGADLSTAHLGCRATMREATFVRCDLREVSMKGRSLDGARFYECRLHGSRGPALVAAIEIERPDLSPAGDRSRIGTADEVIEAWSTHAFVH